MNAWTPWGLYQRVDSLNKELKAIPGVRELNRKVALLTLAFMLYTVPIAVGLGLLASFVARVVR